MTVMLGPPMLSEGGSVSLGDQLPSPTSIGALIVDPHEASFAGQQETFGWCLRVVRRNHRGVRK
jgi:hypothetical protein